LVRAPTQSITGITVSDKVVQAFAGNLRGDLLTPNDEGYDEARLDCRTRTEAVHKAQELGFLN
jgi:hypothetical protein